MAEVEGSVQETGNPVDNDSVDGGNEWRNGLDEFSEVIDSKGWKNNNDVLKSYVNLEKAVGADKVVLPQKDSDILQWEGWEKLGVPETSEQYAMNQPDNFESYDSNLSNDMRETFHQAKLTPQQAQFIHDKYVERMSNTFNESVQSQQDQAIDWENSLKKEYGRAFDERIEAARLAVREYGTPELQKALDESGLGSHPELVKAFSKVGMSLGKGPQFKDAESSGQFGITPDMAKEQIAQVRNNPGLYDQSHPEFKLLNEKLTKLTELAYGNEAAR